MKSPIAFKQSMLHLITTESLINTRLYGSLAIVQSDSKSFRPSLPHATIYAVLGFFGVPTNWLKFLKKLTEAPVKSAQNGQEG